MVSLTGNEDRIRAIRFYGDDLINETHEVDPEDNWRDKVSFE